MTAIGSMKVPNTDYSISRTLDTLLEVNRDIFRSNFNRKSFKFNHSLNGGGLFEIPRLVQLAKRMIAGGTAANFSALNFRRASVDSKFTALPEEQRLAETVERLGESGSWIKLTRTQDFDPEYGEMLTSIIDEIEALSGTPLKRDITWPTMTLFLASPKIATPFHIDHESNFLFQVQGEKDVCLFDGTDRELVPDREVERFYNGNAEAANYREDLQERGTVYRLTPGTVVHHPPLAPHWVRNADNISVSVSVGFCMRALEDRARVYQANFILRMIGLKPLPPGRSPARDWMKTSLLRPLEHRHPKNYGDVVFAPMTRLKAPLNVARRLLGRAGK
ncbi:transcription factor [Chelatococcus reniformis]|uniref:JmjC domain-containing protein n=1 Tax=Chelatococcus reniformis TaxID=1494448 RepID=A0A916XA21_9HYPH|nr:transcription factor [Chelatococcus reniformis]GGC58584.1 hypothetical protein GCM10010994_16870 [Chelatococcus reniformis]